MSAPVQTQHQGSIAFNLGAILLAVALGGVGLAYLIDSMRSSRAAADATGLTLTRSLAGQDLEIPAGWFRRDGQSLDSFARQIELRIGLPLGHGAAAVPVDVTLLPRSRVRPSASLLDGVYLHQFKPEQVSGPPGLIGKPLLDRDGYAGETVWYDALAADPFVAKCSRPVAQSVEATCIRAVYLRPGIAAIYEFPEGALAGWRSFDAEMASRMQSIGAL